MSGVPYGDTVAIDTNTTYTVGDGGLTQNNFTTTLKNKLDNIAPNANNYSLITAADDTLGGVKVGGNLTIDGSSVLHVTPTINSKVAFAAYANNATLTSYTNVSSWTIELDTNSNGANSGDVYTIPRNGIYMVTVSAYVKTVQTNSSWAMVQLYRVRGGSESRLFEQVHEEANPATIKKRNCNIAGIWQYNINDIIRIKVHADNIGISPHVTIDSNFRLSILSVD